ncbi:aminoglycoside 3'-phosphotransferase [Leucobacter sp. CSA2]|uniref:Aminoglycoside 3'-phosphotransferase n=1 Tax=Leucobacter edaphi TaxID=2796472 RepID=A0A934QAT6_9MICO|nr:aminoglycoside 3'-phosphotransferase [Leucobacter edaphi]MBK0421136.1 aminoglycoside 3'-phosphotransferase [Leucobacter edaphi]
MVHPSDIAGPPPEETPVPPELQAALSALGLGSAKVEPVWRNEAGGLTFAVIPAATVEPGSPEYFVKWNPVGSGESLVGEAERLRWLAGKHPVPSVEAMIMAGAGEILLTRALPGRSAVSERWKVQPDRALRALGEGLRRLHDLTAADCPFDWGVDQRLLAAGGSAGRDVSELGEAPPIDRLVICQGDPCAPNTLLGEDGSFLAHVDLARLGLADRWADLAVMSLSLEWNYPEYDEAVFWEAYGIDPDPERIAYYRRLWEAE